MGKQSCYLEPSQITKYGSQLGDRGLGVAFLNRKALEEFNNAKFFKTKGVRFLGLSAAFRVSKPDEELFRIQLSGISRSVSLHLACCEYSGTARPYRLLSEPGQLYSRRTLIASPDDVVDATIAALRGKLPKDFPVEVCQNSWMQEDIFSGFVRACDRVSNDFAVVPGLQVWLSPFGRVSAGALMGRRKYLLSRFGQFSVPEFGVEAPPVPPSPAQKDPVDWNGKWREAAFVRWALSTGLDPRKWPLWCPLTSYFNGPYLAWNWPSLGEFDGVMQRCYDSVALAGGPVGVGTDFDENVLETSPVKQKGSKMAAL